MTNEFTPPRELIILARVIMDLGGDIDELAAKRERMLELYNLTVERLKQEHDARVTNQDF